MTPMKLPEGVAEELELPAFLCVFFLLYTILVDHCQVRHTLEYTR
jgi:hypothetical protein